MCSWSDGHLRQVVTSDSLMLIQEVGAPWDSWVCEKPEYNDEQQLCSHDVAHLQRCVCLCGDL